MVRHWTVLFGMALGLAAPLALTPTAMADSQHVTLEQLPDPVRATVTRETEGGTIKDIEKETKGGQTVYEVEFTPKEGARKVELKIAPDGKVLERDIKY